MIIIGYIILIFTAVQLIVSVVNLITVTHLPHTKNVYLNKVSILIPARNEEHNIGKILSDLCEQPYENIEILIFDDMSEDATARVVSSFAGSDKRIRLIRSGGLPPGWTGKNFGCHSLSTIASGDYFLFLDADVRVSGTIITDTISYSEEINSDLISIFPMQILRSWGEWFTVPAMNYVLVSLLPLFLVHRSRFSSLAAANGQFMFFKASAYLEILPHMKFKDNKVEDIVIARYFKSKNRRVSCLLGDKRIACRMYQSGSKALNGFSKNFTEFFGGSDILAVLFWIVTTAGVIVIYFIFPLKFFVLYLLAVIFIRIAISLSGKQNIFRTLLCIIPVQLSMGLFLMKALDSKIKRKHLWKGRNVN